MKITTKPLSILSNQFPMAVSLLAKRFPRDLFFEPRVAPVRQSFSTETIHEIETIAVVLGAAPSISPGPVRARNRQALRYRVLLQGQVGTCGRVSAVIQEEPLPAAEEAGGNGTHAQGLDGPAALPHDRRRALGLSRDHRVQKLDGRE